MNSETILLKYLALGRFERTNGEQPPKDKPVFLSSAPHPKCPDPDTYKNLAKQVLEKAAAKMQAGKVVPLRLKEEEYEIHVQPDTDTLKDQGYVLLFFAFISTEFGKNFTTGTEYLFKDFKTPFVNDKNAVDTACRGGKGSLNKFCSPVFTNLFNKYGSSKMAKVQAQVADIRDIMHENVTRAAGNVDQLDEMEEKARQMEDEARKHKKATGSLRRTMMCRRLMVPISIGLLVLLVIAIIVGVLVAKFG